LVVPAALTGIALHHAATEGLRVWQVVLTVSLYCLTMLGITVGFHRLLAHRAFVTPSWVRTTLAIAGSMAAQGPPIYWVSNHRRHHRYAERAGDPHSPHCNDTDQLGTWRGFWHAHIGWTFTHEMTNPTIFCRDLLRDPSIRAVNRRYYIWVALGLVVPMLVGAQMDGFWSGAWNGLLWGGGVRLFVSYHMTNSINSITHLFGYRRFPTRDRSKNNLWLALPTMGEAWHNNHHGRPWSPTFSRAWWEVDVGGALIALLERTGLASRRTEAEMGEVRATHEG
jgi:stearoyl-CoA desaturase (delta-9 desaturase)